MANDGTVETDRMRLRRLTAADDGDLLALHNDAEVMHYLTGGRGALLETIRSETLPRMVGYHERRAGLGYWAAIERSSGSFLGWFALTDEGDAGVSSARGVELGYRLCRSAWGRGYATEGARALIRVCFTELGVRRVFAHTMTVNLRSRRVMEKAGLAHVRTYFEDWPDPIEGSEQGEVEYELRVEDWRRDGGKGWPE
ncbi:MAG: GNAT family N-acetyltransferase [Micromonosporaceae bacterium]